MIKWLAAIIILKLILITKSKSDIIILFKELIYLFI